MLFYENRIKGKIAYILQAVSIIPLLIFGIVVLLLGTQIFTKAMYNEVETELRNVCRNLNTAIDSLYPGDYELVEEGTAIGCTRAVMTSPMITR